MHSMDDLNVHMYACRKVHVLEEQLVEVRAQLRRKTTHAEDVHQAASQLLRAQAVMKQVSGTASVGSGSGKSTSCPRPACPREI